MNPKLGRYLIHFAQNFALVVLAGVVAVYIAGRTYPDFYCKYAGPLLGPYTCQGLSFDFGYEILSWMIMLYCFFAPLFLATLGSSVRYWWTAVALSPVLLLIMVGSMGGADPTIVSLVFYLGIITTVGLAVGWLVRKALTKLAPTFITKII